MQEDTCTDFKLKPWQVGLATSKASRGAAARPDDGVSHSGCEAADVTDPGLPLRRPVRWRGKNRRRFSKPPPQRGGADDRRGGGSRAEASLRSATYDTTRLATSPNTWNWAQRQCRQRCGWVSATASGGPGGEQRRKRYSARRRGWLWWRRMRWLRLGGDKRDGTEVGQEAAAV